MDSKMTGEQARAWAAANREALNRLDKDGYPPILGLAIRNNVDATAALLDAGAPANASYPAAFHQAATGTFERQPGDWPLAMFAAMHGAGAVFALLLDRGATIPDEHVPAVITRVAGARPAEATAQAIRILLRSYDIAAHPETAAEALVSAAFGASLPVVQALLEAGAPLGHHNAKGDTVTHAALGLKWRLRMRADRQSVLALLLERGAPVHLTDANGDLPMTLALRVGAFEAVLLLLRAGSPGVGHLSADSADRLAAVVERARGVEVLGAPAADLFDLAAANAWDLVLGLGEAGMQLDAMTTYDKAPWLQMLEKAPLELQVRALPFVADKSLMLRIVAGKATNEDGIARLKAALALGFDVNAPDTPSEYRVSTVLGAALRENAPVEVLEMILAHGANVNGVAGLFSPAHDAARHIGALKWLASKGADLDQALEKHGTPLQRAVEQGWDDGIVFLAKAGVRVDVKDAEGRTPLERARQRKAKKKVVDALAARSGPEAATQVADNRPVEVRATERSALSMACARGDIEWVRKAVEGGADPNAQDARGSTPLAIAIAHGHLPLVEALLELGADVETSTRNGLRPWALAKLLEHPALERRLRTAGARTTSVLLLETGNAFERYATCVARGDVAGLAASIAAGMDVDFPLLGRSHPITRAIHESRDDVVDVLLRAGADPNTAGDTGVTSLMQAAGRGSVDIVTRLLAAGADAERISNGWNAAGFAKDAGHDAVVALLGTCEPTMGAPDRPNQATTRPPVLSEAPGRVAVLVNGSFYDEDPTMPFWFDHDLAEDVVIEDGDVVAALRKLSHEKSFAEQAAEAIAKLGVTPATLFVLFDSIVELSPGPLPPAWRGVPGIRMKEDAAYAGDFAYKKGKRSKRG